MDVSFSRLLRAICLFDFFGIFVEYIDFFIFFSFQVFSSFEGVFFSLKKFSNSATGPPLHPPLRRGYRGEWPGGAERDAAGANPCEAFRG